VDHVAADTDALGWLLEDAEPGPRYLALRDIVRPHPESAELGEARQAAHRSGPMAAILAAMDPAGFWEVPGHGYLPKYRSTVWSVIALAELGASADEDPRVERACAYVLDHAMTPHGQFTTSGAPSGTVDCLHGNLCWALLELGCQDERLDTAFEWLARTVTGEGMAPAGDRSTPVRWFAAKCGPGFRCGANGGQPCGWGAAKALMALGRLPAARRTALTERATRAAVDFLLGIEPTTGAYPTAGGAKPSGNWWKFGFPVFYVTDLLQVAEALVAAGRGNDPRLAATLELVRGKRGSAGRWPLDYTYAGKTWGQYGAKGLPNKWVTIRAVRVLVAQAGAGRGD
jgi:hypothetical protein